MQSDLKAIFFELLATNEKLFDFVQEFADNGVCLFSKEHSRVWFDNKILKCIGKENDKPKAGFNKEDCFTPSSLHILNAVISSDQQLVLGKTLALLSSTKPFAFISQIRQVVYKEASFIIIAFGEEVADTEPTEATRLITQLSIADKINFLKTIYLQDIFFFGIMEVDENEDFRYGFLNKYYEDILGVKNTYLQGKTPKEIAPEFLNDQSAEIITNDFRECYKTGKIIKRNVEIEISGKKRLTSVYINPIRENDGKISSLLACGIDITELKELQNQLSLDNDFLLQMYEATPTVSHSIDEKGYIRFVSDKWLKKLGYTREEVIGKKSTDFLTEESRKYAQQVVLPDFFKQGYCEDIPYEMLTKSGEILNVRLSGKLLKPIGDYVKVSIAHIEDATNEALAKQEKSKTESILTDLLNNTKIHLWAFDGEVYHYMNKEWYDYTGQDPNLPLTIERWIERIHPEDLPKATEVWLKHFEQKTEHENYFRLKRHDGVYRYFYCKVIPVFDNDGNFFYFQGHNIDITDRIEAENKLKESKERLSLSVEAAEIGLWDWRLDTKVAQYNEKYAEIIGYTLEEITPMTSALFTSLIHPEDFSILTDNLDKHIRGQAPHFECEIRMKHKKGHWVWVFNRGTTIEKDQHGKAVRMSGTLLDVTDRKIAEKALKESKERLQLSIEGAGVCLWDWYIQSGKVRYNEKWATMTGYSHNELGYQEIGKIFELCHLEDRERVKRQLDAHFEGKTEYYEVELRVKHKAGHWIWILDKGKIVEWDKEGKPYRMSGTHVDITTSKLAEQKIKESEERLQKLTKNVPGVIYQYEMTPDGETYFSFLSGTIAKVNDEFQPEEIAKDPQLSIDLIHPDDKPIFESAIIHSKENLTPFNVEYRFVKKDGTIRWHNASSVPEKQTDGTVVWYGIFQDVTEKIEAKKQMEQLAQIVENTSDMIYTCDENGRITWANSIHKTILGLDPEKIIGKKPSEKIKTSKEGMEKVLELENALINRQPFNDIIFRYIKDGQPIWLNYNVTPIFNKAGEFLYSIVSKTDVSKLIQQQKELKQLLKMSSDQNKRLKEYSYITSHNIRSNVASILGLLDLLLDDPTEMIFIEKLETAAKQLDVTIRNISELLQLEKEYANIEKAKYDINAALERIIALNQRQINEKQAVIKVEQAEQIIINTVPAYMDSIIQNLLTNALKYGITKSQKDLEIIIEHKSDTLNITFKDKGLGINLEKYGHKLFTLGGRFHRVNKGNGLGLFMTLRQVEALQGKIDVDSKENEGSTFTVTLPLN